MNLKPVILIALSILFFGSAHAQDKIYKKNGDIISAAIKEVNVKSVLYRREDNPDGPFYTINNNGAPIVQFNFKIGYRF